MSLEALLQNNTVWRGRDQPVPRPEAYIGTGYPSLDAALPGGGWPRRALSEILYSQNGVGELQLLMPALVRLNQDTGWLVWIAPPFSPYAPALASAGIDLSRLLVVQAKEVKENLWALEQALRSATCSAVLGWLSATTPERQLRRLQLAAEESHTPAFLFRPEEAAQHASPAAVRIRLVAKPTGLQLHLLKCRGSWGRKPIHIDRPYVVA